MTKLLKMSLGIFVLSFLVQIVVCNHMTVKTKELHTFSEQITDVQSQISVINQQIYLASSITGLEDKAIAMGFNQMSTPVRNASSPTIARAF